MHIAVWGLAFKPNTDDMREAPSLTLIERCSRRGRVDLRPRSRRRWTRREPWLGDRIEYAETNYEALDGADALVVVTDWNEYRHPDFARMKRRSSSRSSSTAAICTTSRRCGSWRAVLLDRPRRREHLLDCKGKSIRMQIQTIIARPCCSQHRWHASRHSIRRSIRHDHSCTRRRWRSSRR